MTDLVACLECDLLHRPVPLPPGGEARCTRCRALLYRQAAPDANERTLALVLAAGILFVIANLYPIVGLEVQGTHTGTTLFGAVRSLWREEARAVAALVFVTTLLVPAAELAGLSWCWRHCIGRSAAVAWWPCCISSRASSRGAWSRFSCWACWWRCLARTWAILIATAWRIGDRADKLPRESSGSHAVRVEGFDVAALVAAHRLALARLGADIARDLDGLAASRR